MGDARGSSSESSGRLLRRRDTLKLGLGATAAIALAACGPSPEAAPSPGGTSPIASQDAAPKKLADSVVFGTRLMAASLDPHVYLPGKYMVDRQIYDTLLWFDADGQKLIPQLASEWKRIDDRTIELKLRDDVKFSNGENFTAETVKFNVDRVLSSKDPLGTTFRQRLDSLAGAEVVNSTTVRIMSNRNDPLLLNRMTVFTMGPKSYLESGADVANKPVGTGPFNVVDFQRTNQVQLEAWDGSWRAKPRAKSAKIIRFPELATMLSALRTGEIDIAHNVPGDRLAGLQNQFNAGTQPGGEASVALLLPQLSPALKDKRVRQALNYAVNKDELVKTIKGGVGRVAQGQMLEPNMPGYDSTVTAYPYDPDQARRLLREAGFPRLDLVSATDVPRQGLALAVAGYLKAIDVNLTVNLLENAAYTTQFTQKTDYPVLFWAPLTFLLRDYNSATGAWYDHGGRKLGWFPNDRWQTLASQIDIELDAEKRAAAIKEATALMRDEAPCIFLTWEDFAVVYSKKVAPLALTYDTTVHLWEVEKEA